MQWRILNLDPKWRMAILGSAVFLIAATIYGQKRASSPEPGIPFTAEGIVVSTKFVPERYSTEKPYAWRREYSHANARAKLGAEYRIHIKLDDGKSLTSTCTPQEIDHYPAGRRVKVEGELVEGMFFGKDTAIRSMTPIK